MRLLTLNFFGWLSYSVCCWCQSFVAAGIPKNATYFQQPVDHLSQSKKFTNKSWKQRYYTEFKYFQGPGKPIFLIFGGESNIEPSTGIVYPFVVQLAQTFGGAVIQPEHRFYGESQPISSEEIEKARKAGEEDPRVHLLTSEQALMDANELIRHFQTALGCSKDRFSNAYCPVITVGGSYPGFLSAMARLRFPHVVDMAYAGSAPMYFYAQQVPDTAYYDHITKVADKAYPFCSNAVQKTLDSLAKEVHSEQEWPHNVPYNELGLCSDSIPPYIEDTETFLQELFMMVGYTFANLNMAYYPPSNKTGLYRACEIFSRLPDAKERVKSFLLGFLASPEEDCVRMISQLPSGKNATITGGDWSGVGTGQSGESWDFQTCSLLVETISFGPSSMFPQRPWTLHWLMKHCMDRFGVRPRPLDLVSEWGFDDLIKQGASNILFTNGLNDGWSVSGIQHNLSDTLVALNFPNGAHHSDLSGHWPSDRDTDDIREGFVQITALLGKWLAALPGGNVKH